MPQNNKTGLNLDVLREANRARLPHFKNAKGEPAHINADGSDWSLNDWFTAVAGETGELGNLLKNVRRGDMTLDDARSAIRDEMADIITYLDLLAQQCDVDLTAAVVFKFNEVSDRVNFKGRIVHNRFGWCYDTKPELR